MKKKVFSFLLCVKYIIIKAYLKYFVFLKQIVLPLKKNIETWQFDLFFMSGGTFFY